MPPKSKKKENVHANVDEDEEMRLVGAVNDNSGSLSGRIWNFIHEDPLLAYTLLGVACGMCLGIFLSAALPGKEDESGTRKVVVTLVSLPGKMFLNLLKMMVLPLVFGSMISGVCSLKAAGANVGKMANITLTYFAATTIIAVVIGLVVVNVFQPGSGTELETEAGAKSSQSMLDTMLGVIMKLTPPNIVEAMATMNVLGVITFSLFFGVILSRLPDDQGAPMIAGINVFNEVVMGMVTTILWLSPIGIACLIAGNMCESPDLAQTARRLSIYSFCVIFGIALHALLVLPAIYYYMTKENPVTFMRGLRAALMTAFGTDSSAATLPVTIMCCQKMGISNEVCQFVLPLGATVNMNGTALYEALTVMFIAQVHNEPMTLMHMIVIAATSTLAAVGAAAIPSAGLVTMVMVLSAAGLDQYVSDLSIIFTIDWALDRFRTMCNVLGDAFGAAIVQHMCKDDYSPTKDQSEDQRGIADEGKEGSLNGRSETEEVSGKDTTYQS